jgi:hypothetical protein
MQSSAGNRLAAARGHRGTKHATHRAANAGGRIYLS